jgi:hypothetical protein
MGMADIVEWCIMVSVALYGLRHGLKRIEPSGRGLMGWATVVSFVANVGLILVLLFSGHSPAVVLPLIGLQVVALVVILLKTPTTKKLRRFGGPADDRRREE